MSDFIPRPSQQQILAYSGGRLGVAAVPGAGKTHALSALAAKIIRGGFLEEDQEVLIVTLVNSAVDNFETRIRSFFENPTLAAYKYRVRTLHGLAHDIVRERPAGAGLDSQFKILDDNEAQNIRREAARAWLASHSLDEYLDPGLDPSRRDWIIRERLPETAESLATAFIRSAKDRLLTPETLRLRLNALPARLPLAEMGCEIYEQYQQALRYRGAVDFDDLIRLALVLLQNDAEYLARLRSRYPYILEDEAQDSSQTQQRILEALSGPNGNWVRVGDPNQAIFETFTTADPELLRAFIRQNPSADMRESGRSQPSIIALANRLIEWTMREHPVVEARDALSPPFIYPAPAGDSQPNPPDDPKAVKVIVKKFSPEEELAAVVKSIQQYVASFADLPEEQKPTVAVLVPRNNRGVEFIEALKRANIETVEMLSSTSETRAAAGSLSLLLSYLADSKSASKLFKAYEVWRRDWRGKEAQDGGANPDLMRRVTALLKKILHVENYVAPAHEDWLRNLAEPPEVLEEMQAFRANVQRWLNAALLPIDQLILTLARDVFTRPADLALAHKLALVLRQAAEDHPAWRLPELTDELTLIAKNERKFIGFSEDDSGFDPRRHRGKVAVVTMHKAKGLEWDRVYLTSVNNYDFPANLPGDTFISEKRFLRGALNLEAEALAQLAVLESGGEFDWYREGEATLQARLGYVKERLRLLYVAITRAKSDLIITWNTGRKGEAVPARALEAFADFQQ